jgi:hypothetical protein
VPLTVLPMSRDDVVAAIRRLADAAPQTREELSALETDSVELALYIQKRTSLHDVPEDVWHFLADADIRFKDEKYARAQLERLDDALKYWVAESR